MSALWVIVVVLVLLALVGVPGLGPWHHSYGYYPSGVVTIIVIVLLLLVLTGRL
jgi:ABC-type methionine transport system permease subunit